MTFARMKSITKEMGFLNSVLFIVLSLTLYQSLFHLPIVGAKIFVLVQGDEIVSRNGKFTLGFFTIPSTNLTYLGIWLTNEKENMKVWVANRNTPVIGNGILSIDDSGTLSVRDNGSGPTYFSTGFSNTVTADLDECGALTVYNESDPNSTPSASDLPTVSNASDPISPLWVSYDHPTDTLLSHGTLGYDLTTKRNWTLNSWLSDQVPATGAFTMRLEEYEYSPQLLNYRRGKHYWASGPWNKTTRSFQFVNFAGSSVPGFPDESDLFSNASSMIFTYLPPLSEESSVLKLSPNGQLIMGATLITKTPDFCYGYESDNGCVVSTALPNCRGKSDSFQYRDWIGGSSINDDNSSISHGDCTERCWNDCNCVGFNTMHSNGTGCIFWPVDATFKDEYESNQTVKRYVLVGPNPPSPPPSPPSPPPPPPKNWTWIWILVSSAIVLTFALTCCLCYVRIRRLRLKAQERRMRNDYIHQLTGGSDSFNYGDELERDIQDAPDVKIFSLGAILTATNNFSNENKLGQGGYGPVYKGKLFDGREIAVKRLSKASGQGIEEFKSELILITKLQHTNLVRLYGCCIHQEEKMLIYEFMPNKSLDFFLFAEDKKEKIDWHMRFNIIEGVAQGLLYLHKYSRMKVIHRDLKVSNVLLDGNMNPKIADFGMARIFKQDVTKAMTNRVVGTYGYMAPEYAMEGTFSVKSDVFSFGVLILEIVSGRKNSSFYNPDRPLNLVGYAWELWKRHASLELKDETLGESYDVKQLLRVIHVGLLCVQENANDRPTISDVIYILNNETANLPSPKQPAYFTGRQTAGFHLPEAKSTNYLLDGPIQVSENGLTVTTMEAR